MIGHRTNDRRVWAGLVTIGACLMLTTIAAQETTLEITVLDATNGSPLPGAKVVLLADQSTDERYAGSEGESRAIDLEPGLYTLAVSMPGFKTVKEETDLFIGSNQLTVHLQPFRIVSVIHLLATPDRYDGLPVVVDGFCSIGFEDNALYFHKDDWIYTMTSNALKIEADPATIHKRYNKKYVTVFGVFVAGPTGGLYGGRINSIEKVVLLERRR